MKPITIDDIKVMNLGLGRSIYSPGQLEEFACYQESQGTRRAFLAESAESAERAYNSRSGGQWGSGLSDLATERLIHAVRYHLVPMYLVIRPIAAVALLVLFLVGILRMLLDIVIRAIAIARIRGCGWWLMGSFWGHRRGGRAIGSHNAAQQLGQARELVQRVLSFSYLRPAVEASLDIKKVQMEPNRVYPIPLNRNVRAAMGSLTTVDMNVENENGKRGQPKH